MKTQYIAALSAALSSVLLAACAAPSASSDAGTTAIHGTSAAVVKSDAAPASPIDLRGYTWNIDTATDAAGKPIALLQREGKYGFKLSFNGDNLGVSGGCNHIGTGFKLAGDRIEIGDFRTTLMACQDQRLMQMDSVISEQLKGSARFAIEGEAPQPRLLLTTAGGAKLVLNGEPTAETRYGGPGVTMFLEVAPQLRKCGHPLIPNYQCMWVRERKYDGNGVSLKPVDEWQFLYQDIEGYTHEAGIRNVLRVKKFDVKDAPPDASSVAYLLDKVMETDLRSASEPK